MIITSEGEVLGSVLRSAVPGAEPDDGSIANASDDFSEEAHIAPAFEGDLEYVEVVQPEVDGDESAGEEPKDEPTPESKPEPKTEPAKPAEPVKAAPAKAAAKPATGLKSALDTKG